MTVALWISVGHLQGTLGLGVEAAQAARPPTPIGGASTAQYRSTYTLRGQTGGTRAKRAAGIVMLRGRWNKGAWMELARTRTDSLGRYLVSIVLGRRGTLELRLLTPDSAIFTKTLRVS